MPQPPLKQPAPWDVPLTDPNMTTAPDLNILQRLFGPSFMARKLKTDIPLPNDTGQIDMRLLTGTPERQMYLKAKGSPLENIQEGYNILKNLGRQK